MPLYGFILISGAALLSPHALITWGERLEKWLLPGLTRQMLADGPFGEGGCLMDVDGDGLTDVILVEGRGLGKLVWRRAPKWESHLIDSEVEMHDCRAATLFGRRGLLMIQRHMQLRFYEFPGAPDEPWPSTEIYSIYTASRQGGLEMADVNGDGLPDLFCGNYWVQSPASFDLPWRIFAINLLHLEPAAATFRMLMDGPDLVAAQGEMESGRVTRFRKPADPKQLWTEIPMAELHYPHALARVGGQIWVGENNGSGSRLVKFPGRGTTVLKQGVHTLIPYRKGALAIGADTVTYLRK